VPRSLHTTEPETINFVASTDSPDQKYLEVATGNKDKLKEIQDLLPGYRIVGKNLNVAEIQDLDPIKVATAKAKAAYVANGYNPILVEDTSVEISGLGNRPGTYAKDFFEDFELRNSIVKFWLKGRDRSAKATVVLALYDGKEVHTWQGIVQGKIAQAPTGKLGFGWDDIFIPKGTGKTFAQMSASQKNKYSMRKKAIEEFFKYPPNLGYPVLKLPEPYKQELERARPKKLSRQKAIQFAYSLECLEGANKPNNKFDANKYTSISTNPFFTRFLVKKNTPSLGLMLTDVDRNRIEKYENGNPMLWQMGPERRHLSLLQRAEFFLSNQNEMVHKTLDKIQGSDFPARVNTRSNTIEAALGMEGNQTITKATSLKEIGYKKLSSENYVSRTKSADYGLFNKIGKHARSIYGVGCLPFVSGWRDVIVSSAIGHMIVFVHRNNINAIDFGNQFRLIKESQDIVKKIGLGKKATVRALNNIGAAIGCDPGKDVEKAKKLHHELGVNAFRIYTINSDPRIIETAKALRQALGAEVEIFVGQVVDKDQALRLVASDIQIDSLVIGHGGGRQCTSAINGMALSTLEELYGIITDMRFNNTSILVEGGIGTNVGPLLVMGVDCILRNAQFASCVIEQGDLYYKHVNGKFCQPYHGSASAATMIIESQNPKNMDSRLFYSGRTKKVEGKSGYIFYKERANSMAFYIEEFKHYAARTLADLGVESIYSLREFLQGNSKELLRIVTTEAGNTSRAYGSQ
jgi:non-canonical purine NTP pyrophosphatase (RdgB/HAM1 family)